MNRGQWPLPILTTYPGWASGYAFPPGTEAATDDAEGDGMDNAFEWLFGSNPLASDTSFLPQQLVRSLSAADYPAAIADYTEAVSKKPDYVKAFENRGQAYYATKKFEEASKDFREVEKLTEKPSPELFRLLGDTYYSMKKFVVAREYYDKVIAAGVKDKDVYFKRGMMQLEEEEFQGALTDFDNAKAAGENTVALYIKPGGSLLIRAPWFVPAYILLKYVESKAPWITRHREKLKNIKPDQTEQLVNEGDTIPFMGGELKVRTAESVKYSVTVSENELFVAGPGVPGSPPKITALTESWYLKEAKEYFEIRTRHLAGQYGDRLPQPGSISVRKMKRRWGTCRSNGAILFNRQLIKKDTSDHGGRCRQKCGG